MKDAASLLEPLRNIHNAIRDTVIHATEKRLLDELAGIRREEEGDTIYAIDAVSEDKLLELFNELARDHSFVLIAEGLPGGRIVLPHGASEGEAQWRIIVDPIDGTREIMYQKRSAWILTGVAQNRGAATSLRDIVVAVQTEIPLVKQHLSDQLWAVTGRGAEAERYNRLTGERAPLEPRPSNAPTIAHGFAMISRFFPGCREELAAIDEEIVMGALGPVAPGKAHCFEDQYLSSGGQLYELMAGHDRFVADLRPLVQPVLASRGLPLGICCHPYDVCSVSIATELGIIVTDPYGNALDAPLNVEANVAWAGYANEQIRRQIEPLLQSALRKRGWI
ncbi:MAG: inositol monophosphatase [Acidobacteria bacterium]|nr:inositol monophosphatase [Acidobacteriota bacterium]